MKIINAIMIIAVGILIYAYIGMDSTNNVIDTVATQSSDNAQTAVNQTAKETENTSTAVTLQAEKTVSTASASANSNVNSSYYKNNTSYEDVSSSYSQSNSNDSQNSSSNSDDYSYSQSSSNGDSSSSSVGQSNNLNSGSNSSSDQSSSSGINSDAQANQDDSNSEDSNASTDDKTKTENPNAKFQRIYDNGIVWYGDTGSLTVEYQASSPQTTGIGFRVHFDNTSMRVTNVTQYPVDAITATSAASSQSDARNYDDNELTNNFLTFAWASIYGQWPQTNQVSLATIEFVRVNGGSSNYNVAYTAISTSAGYQFIR